MGRFNQRSVLDLFHPIFFKMCHDTVVYDIFESVSLFK